jgi:hypothetical protein
MRKTAKSLKALKVGDWVKVYWTDPSADSVEDGSAKELIKANKPIKYGTLGHFIGMSKEEVILCNDERQEKKDEWRGTLNIAIALIYRVEIR